MKIRFFLLLLAFGILNIDAQIQLRLPSILSNHAVLQQSSDVKLWGWGPGAFTLKVVCSWNKSDTVFVPIDATCMWETSIKTPKAGASQSIQFICGKQTITIEDIVLGEVWLCSGQSNMEFNYGWGISDAGDALNTCNNNEIRFFQVPQSFDKYPLSDLKGEWKICDASSMKAFSSVGYFFGRKINEQTKMPVGLIGSYWGGTSVQAWMPKEVFDENADLKQFSTNIEAYGWAAKGACGLYNAMINPLTNYKIAGTIWYQGEANVATEYNSYEKLFTSMITSWRKAFNNDFPFYFVQIAPCNYYEGIKCALLTEQQQSASSFHKTGMINIGDLVDDVTNLHPQKKRAVGERLANLVLKEQYGQNQIQPYSPRFSSVEIVDNKAFVKVNSLGTLVCKDKEIKNFQIAGDDKVFYPAKATIEKDGRIVLTSKQVKMPVAVRYCFTNDAIPSLFDINGLPLLSFRTDKW